MLDKVKEIVATVAPTVATALGGPLAGVATRMIADKVLGKPDASAEEIEAAIGVASPATLLQLKQVEAEFAVQMRELDVEVERIAVDDRASARARAAQMKDWTPSMLGAAIILGFFALLSLVMFNGLPETGGEVLMIMIGALAAMTTQVGNYFFGSSAGSASKNQIIADLKKATV